MPRRFAGPRNGFTPGGNLRPSRTAAARKYVPRSFLHPGRVVAEGARVGGGVLRPHEPPRRLGGGGRGARGRAGTCDVGIRHVLSRDARVLGCVAPRGARGARGTLIVTRRYPTGILRPDLIEFLALEEGPTRLRMRVTASERRDRLLALSLESSDPGLADEEVRRARAFRPALLLAFPRSPSGGRRDVPPPASWPPGCPSSSERRSVPPGPSPSDGIPRSFSGFSGRLPMPSSRASRPSFSRDRSRGEHAGGPVSRTAFSWRFPSLSRPASSDAPPLSSRRVPSTRWP